MLLDILYYNRNSVLVEKNHAIQVQFRTKQVEEHILAVAFVELRDYILHLILHGKSRRGVRETRNHLSNTRLQRKHFFLKVLIFLLELVSFFTNSHELRCYHFKFILSLR